MQINMLGIFTDRFAAMRDFYRDVLDMEVTDDREQYVEFGGQGVRVAICDRAVMVGLELSKSFDMAASGHVFSLAFECASPELVDRELDRLITAGAEHVQGGTRMPWGQYTAFFADPDGHIHELFARIEN
jgi:lactoylglutathione lyase